jgi:outer membrane protein assembly factor BamB
MSRALTWVVVLSGFLLLRCGGEVGGAQDGPAPEGEETTHSIPKVKNEAIISSDGNTAVDAGFAGNGTAISIPTGFVASQCKFTAAAANIDGSAISTSVSINTTTGEVICEKVVQEREEIPPETQDCVASYTVVCTK